MRLKHESKTGKQRRFRCHAALISLAMALSALTAFGLWAPKAQAVDAPEMLTKEAALATADGITAETDPDHLITFTNPNGDEPDEPGESGESGEPTDPSENETYQPTKAEIQEKLNWIRDNGDGGWYRVVIPPGDYDFGEGNGFRIYSNTILDCRPDENGNDVKFCAGAVDGMLVRSGDKMDPARGVIPNPGGYDDYQNIMVLGGTWSGRQLNGSQSEDPVAGGDVAANSEGCNIRFGHASNVYLIGMRVEDNYNTHHVELGAVNGCLVSDCYFTGAHGNGSIEAVQLDITHRHTENFSGFWPYDDKPTINTTVQNCTFENLHRGVGSHHLILGAPYDNIKIINNTFRNLEDRAIAAGYFTNSEISGNTMEDVNSGINIAYMLPKTEDAERGQTYLKNDENSTDERITNANLVVKKNTIRLNATQAPWNGSSVKYGIRAGGELVTEQNRSYNEIITTSDQYTEEEKTKRLPIDDSTGKGEYYVSGVTIEDNTITASGDTGNINAGIFARYLMNSTIQNNIISIPSFPETVDTDTGETINVGAGRGVTLQNTKDISVLNNEISNNSDTTKDDNDAGISVQDGTTGAILKGNTIENGNGWGVMVTNATATDIANNTISGCQMESILVLKKGTVTGLLNNNTITGANAEKSAILVNDSTVTRVNNNTIKGQYNKGVMVYKGSTANSVYGNTITGAGGDGIQVNGSKVPSVNANKISAPGGKGIIILDSTSGNVNLNEVSNAGGDGIQINNSTVTNCNENTVSTTAKKGIIVTDGATVTTMQKNSITGSKEFGICINAATVKNVLTNTLTKCTGDASLMLASGAKVTGTISGNEIVGAVKTSTAINVKASTAAKIESNKISGTVKNGIMVHESGKATSILSNTVGGAVENGIMVYKGSATNINSNTITAPGKKGIITDGATVTTIQGNKVSTSKDFGICVSASTVKDIKTNTLSKCAQDALILASGAKVTGTISGNKIVGGNKAASAINVNASTAASISSNTISGLVKNGIFVHDKGKATSILSNTVGTTTAGVSGEGIFIYKASATNVNSNKVYLAASNGINLNGSTVTNIKSNTLSKSGASGILLNAGSNVSGLLYGNTITGKNTATYGIHLNGSKAGKMNSNTINGSNSIGIFMHKNGTVRSTVTTIYGNKVTGANTNGIQVDGTTVTNLNSNTLTSNKMFGIIVKGGADVVHANANTFSKNGKNNKPYVDANSKGIFLVPGTAKVAVKKTLNLTPKLIQSTNTSKVTWKSSSTAVATVSAKGVVTGKKKGTVTITATKQTRTTTCKVTVG